MGMENLKGEKRASECTRVIKDVLMIETEEGCDTFMHVKICVCIVRHKTQNRTTNMIREEDAGE